MSDRIVSRCWPLRRMVPTCCCRSAGSRSGSSRMSAKPRIAVSGCAQLVAHVGQELGLRPPRRQCAFVRLPQVLDGRLELGIVDRQQLARGVGAVHLEQRCTAADQQQHRREQAQRADALAEDRPQPGAGIVVDAEHGDHRAVLVADRGIGTDPDAPAIGVDVAVEGVLALEAALDQRLTGRRWIVWFADVGALFAFAFVEPVAVVVGLRVDDQHDVRVGIVVERVDVVRVVVDPQQLLLLLDQCQVGRIVVGGLQADLLVAGLAGGDRVGRREAADHRLHALPFVAIAAQGHDDPHGGDAEHHDRDHPQGFAVQAQPVPVAQQQQQTGRGRQDEGDQVPVHAEGDVQQFFHVRPLLSAGAGCPAAG